MVASVVCGAVLCAGGVRMAGYAIEEGYCEGRRVAGCVWLGVEEGGGLGWRGWKG